tara:strand:+ start:1765 stop:1944 length:180 start_codon:yes stop_codon:yes gene_type:complete
MSEMTHILVSIGCPSGSTDWGNGSITVQVSEGFERDFVEAIIHHARLFAKEYTLESEEE